MYLHIPSLADLPPSIYSTDIFNIDNIIMSPQYMFECVLILEKKIYAILFCSTDIPVSITHVATYHQFISL